MVFFSAVKKDIMKTINTYPFPHPPPQIIPTPKQNKIWEVPIVGNTKLVQLSSFQQQNHSGIYGHYGGKKPILVTNTPES